MTGAADGGGSGLGAAEHMGAVQRDSAVAHGAQPEALGGVDDSVRAAARKIQPGALRGLDKPRRQLPAAVWAGSGAGRDGFLRHVGHPLCSINDAGGQSVTGKIKKAPGGVNGRGLNLGTLGW